MYTEALTIIVLWMIGSKLNSKETVLVVSCMNSITFCLYKEGMTLKRVLAVETVFPLYVTEVK